MATDTRAVLASGPSLCYMNSMSGALDRPGPMSLTAFLTWDAPDGCPWQLVDGEPTAMPRPVRPMP